MNFIKPARESLLTDGKRMFLVYGEDVVVTMPSKEEQIIDYTIYASDGSKLISGFFAYGEYNPSTDSYIGEQITIPDVYRFMETLREDPGVDPETFFDDVKEIIN